MKRSQYFKQYMEQTADREQRLLQKEKTPIKGTPFGFLPDDLEWGNRQGIQLFLLSEPPFESCWGVRQE